jgi:predicted tellurium resistance membrane protein TerC
MLDWLTDPQAWVALGTLTALEIVLGIDNVIFISILAGRLPEKERERARVMGLAGAMVMRVGLLLSIAWVMRLTEPLFTVMDLELSGRDLILLGGGLFLLGKSTLEIHHDVEGAGNRSKASKAGTMLGVITQIMLLDMVFSLDSVITAIGLAERVPVMVVAIVIASIVMMVSSRAVGGYLEKHPTLKVLALSFLLLIGVALLAEGLGLHVPRGYIYFAMAFSTMVELLNMRVRRKAEVTA